MYLELIEINSKEKLSIKSFSRSKIFENAALRPQVGEYIISNAGNVYKMKKGTWTYKDVSVNGKSEERSVFRILLQKIKDEDSENF